MEFGVELVIIAIVIVLVLLVVGYIMRKKYYKEIDRLETAKLELMHRPVAEEMAKVKRLNMTGQTEELFENWRKTWDNIVTIQLPDIDEMLFDAEEYTDKYRFKQAKNTHERIETLLIQIEDQINVILDELAELLGSEEKNRVEMEKLVDEYGAVKKNLLAHRHQYGIAADQLEKLLESIAEKVERFDSMTEQGNYLEARELVLAISAEIEQLISKMEKTPDLLTECQTIIPAQRNEIADGMREMKQQGFVIEHLQIEKQLQQIDKELGTYRAFLENAEVDEVESGLQEIKEKIDVLYDLLEKEVYAKHNVLQENEKIGFILDQLQGVNNEIKAETDLIQNSYQLLDNEIEVPRDFEENLSELMRRYELLEAKIGENESAYSLLNEELKAIESQLTDLQSEQALFSEKLQNLRKDELDAQEKVLALQKRVNDIIRIVKKSRMPGLPGDFEPLYDQAEEQIENVYKCLDEKPLNMKSVQQNLYEASDTVDHLFMKAEEHIENAQFAERIIQYGNRYRGRYPDFRTNLEKAEQAFRNYEYKSAMEQAATAVEEVEPGALKRIDEMMNEESKA